MNADNFFDEQTDYSKVKSLIVSKYFGAWARIIKNRADKMLYLDLFSGPGRYADGSESTPLVIAKAVIANEDLRKKVLMIFNDKDANAIKKLETDIGQISGIKQLTHAPDFWNADAIDVEKALDGINLIPTFSFVDPFGYRGLTQKLIHQLTKDWGCDCIFFFNYSRIRAAIENPRVDEIITLMFGKERADKLKKELKYKYRESRERHILKELFEGFKEQNPELKYFLPFRFKNAESGQSYMLIFVTKNPTGCKIMTDIMAKASSENHQDVGSFAFDKKTLDFEPLFGRLDELCNDLIKKFSGREGTFEELYKEHSTDLMKDVRTPYTEKNYKDAFKKLEKEGKVRVIDPEGKRKPEADTLADRVIIKFLE